MQAPLYDDVLDARARVYRVLRPTALIHHPLLDEWTGCQTWVKHENHNPTGAFKVRGGINLVSQLGEDDRRRGVISASTGNHGQSMALACRAFGVRCRIVVPVGNNPDKNAAMRAYGAEVEEHGRDFDEAREFVESLVAREGWRYVHSANEPHLIAGVGTYAHEIFEDLPDPDCVFVPVGGGSGACGCCIVRNARGARTKIIGVNASGADAFARSWRGPVRVSADRADTFAEGIATRTTYDLTFSILAASLDDVVTVTDDELWEGMAAALTRTHNLAEGAGAAALAAARAYGRRHAGARVVCVMSSGNADLRTLSRLLGIAGASRFEA